MEVLRKEVFMSSEKEHIQNGGNPYNKDFRRFLMLVFRLFVA